MNRKETRNSIFEFFTARKRHKLSLRLLTYVILCSSYFTLITTFVQLYFDFRSDIETIENNMKYIEKSYLDAISASMFKIDEEQQKIQLKAITGLRDITYAEVKETRGSSEYSLSEGDATMSKEIIREFPLVYTGRDGEKIPVGMLTVSTSYRGIYDRLWQKFITILGTNAAKTFLASFFIFIIIQLTVTRHLIRIAQYTDTLSIRTGSFPLALFRKQLKHNDELDHVVNAINKMQERIKSDFMDTMEKKNQLKTALTEKNTLLKEIHHRVKNNMQIIISLINLQIANIANEDIIKELQEIENRIRSMAIVHELLYMSDYLSRIDFRDYVESLTGDLVNLYVKESGKIKIDINISGVTFDIETAIPCGLILNELVTNAFKHAFPAGSDGVITISVQGDNEGGYTMTVGDNGAGLPEDFDMNKTNSLGLTLISTLTKQINGNLVINKNNGTSFIINFREKTYPLHG